MEHISYVGINKKQWKEVKEPNPILLSSKSTRLGQSRPAMFEWSTNEKAGRQHPAYDCQPPGGTRHPTEKYWTKTQFFYILSVVGF